MAKKVVATLKDKSAVRYSKIIVAVKNEKTGSYTFREETLPEDDAKAALKG